VASSGVNYFPSWMEIAITIALVSTGFFIFAMAVRYLPIFEHPETSSRPEAVRIAEKVLDVEASRKS